MVPAGVCFLFFFFLGWAARGGFSRKSDELMTEGTAGDDDGHAGSRRAGRKKIDKNGHSERSSVVSALRLLSSWVA
jgi:hypothetical protein